MTGDQAPTALQPDEELELAGFVGPETSVLGTLSFAGNVRIEGRIEGDLLGGKLVILGPQARVHGTVQAQTVVVLGAHVEASIVASKSIELRHSAVVTGDMSAPQIHMDPDIEFSGRCDMHPQNETAGSPPTLPTGR